MPYVRRAANIATSIRMKRQLHSDTVVIVEGSDDRQFLVRHLASGGCRFVQANGRTAVLETIRDLNESSTPGVVGVVDSDFWGLDEGVPTVPNLIVSDTHDLETMLLASPALDHVLAEFGSRVLIQAFEQERGTDVRAALLALASPLGCLRWLSQRNGLGLNFDGLSLEDFVTERALLINEERMLQTVVARSATSARVDVLRGQISDLRTRSPDPWHLCCGHDCVDILSIGLRRALGTNNDAEVTRDRLERALRLAYESRYFEVTGVCRRLREWQGTNAGYVVVHARAGTESIAGT